MCQLSRRQRWMEHHAGKSAAAIPIHARAPTRSFSQLTAPIAPAPTSLRSMPKTTAYSLLLNSGLIRMTLPNARERRVQHHLNQRSLPVRGNYGDASPALYRRPLPSTNLKFLNGIMWDGRGAGFANSG